MGNDTYKDTFSFPIGSTIVIQYKDGGPWTHGVAEEIDGTDHQVQSYIIQVMKTGRLIMHSMMTHMQYTNNNMAMPP